MADFMYDRGRVVNSMHEWMVATTQLTGPTWDKELYNRMIKVNNDQKMDEKNVEENDQDAESFLRCLLYIIALISQIANTLVVAHQEGIDPRDDAEKEEDEKYETKLDTGIIDIIANILTIKGYTYDSKGIDIPVEEEKPDAEGIPEEHWEYLAKYVCQRFKHMMTEEQQGIGKEGFENIDNWFETFINVKQLKRVFNKITMTTPLRLPLISRNRQDGTGRGKVFELAGPLEVATHNARERSARNTKVKYNETKYKDKYNAIPVFSTEEFMEKYPTLYENNKLKVDKLLIDEKVMLIKMMVQLPILDDALKKRKEERTFHCEPGKTPKECRANDPGPDERGRDPLNDKLKEFSLHERDRILKEKLGLNDDDIERTMMYGGKRKKRRTRKKRRKSRKKSRKIKRKTKGKRRKGRKRKTRKSRK